VVVVIGQEGGSTSRSGLFQNKIQQ
jgi:hypothetical protein